jgi:hypothetical protein
MARAAAATALFKKELNSLDGKRVSRDLDDTAKSVDKVGTSSRRPGRRSTSSQDGYGCSPTPRWCSVPR